MSLEDYQENISLVQELAKNYSAEQINQLLLFPDFFERFESLIYPEYSPEKIAFIRDVVYFDHDPEVLNVRSIQSNEIVMLRKKLKIPNLFDKHTKNNISIPDEDEEELQLLNLDIEDEKDEVSMEFSDDDSFFDFLDGGSEELDIELFFDDIEEVQEISEEEYYLSESNITFSNYIEERLLEKAVLIKKEDERLLFENIDVEENYDRFFNGNIRLAIYFAKRYISYDANYYPDYVQQGLLGVLNAMNRFDPSRGFKFSTLATSHIRQQISRFIQDTSLTIRIPVHKREELYQYIKIREEYFISNFNYPNLSYYEKVLDVDKNELLNNLYLLEQCKLISEINNKEKEELNYNNLTNATLEHMNRNELQLIIEDILIKHLTPREINVIEKRFGLNNDERIYTLEEIGEQEGVTRERIRQIEAKSIKKLRSNSFIKTLFHDIFI